MLITRHPWRTGTLVGSLAGALIGGAAMYVAWEHNPQGAIHDESGIDWTYWLIIGCSWFVPVAVPISLACGGFLYVVGPRRGRSAA